MSNGKAIKEEEMDSEEEHRYIVFAHLLFLELRFFV